jgi:hypothetical protein
VGGGEPRGQHLEDGGSSDLPHQVVVILVVRRQ